MLVLLPFCSKKADRHLFQLLTPVKKNRDKQVTTHLNEKETVSKVLLQFHFVIVLGRIFDF